MGTGKIDTEPAVSAKRANVKFLKMLLIDIFVVVFFLSTAAFSLYLFRQDLFQTLDSRDEEPAGLIVIRNNIVQRRYADRVLWDRLFVDSWVYSGDLIRAADLSSATVYIEDNQLDLNENTLIRIEHAPDGKGPFQVELKEGNLSLAAGAGSSGIMLSLMGRQVHAGVGTVLAATAGEDGITVQVSEGTATFIEEGKIRELTEGTMIVQDANGVERIFPAAVVKRPQPNARYLKSGPELLPVDFVWNRINLKPEDMLRLEIAGDSGFTRDFKVIEGLGSQAQADCNAGPWYWRLIFGDAILGKGQFTVADASGPDLKSPAMNSTFRYKDGLPQIRFQWSEKPEASHYLLEISETSDFTSPRISRQSSAASFIQSDLGEGTWYWRVRPVFSSAYDGNAGFSPTASFKIEQSNDPRAPAIEVPDTALAVIAVQPAVSEAVGQTDIIVQIGGAAVGENYTVRRGDVLHEIARQAYGSASLWTLIADANKIPDPDLIEVGEIFYIPPRR